MPATKPKPKAQRKPRTRTRTRTQAPVDRTGRVDLAVTEIGVRLLGTLAPGLGERLRPMCAGIAVELFGQRPLFTRAQLDRVVQTRPVGTDDAAATFTGWDT